MGDPGTIAAAAVTILVLAAVAARQVVGLRDEAPAARWLSTLVGVLLMAFVIAMALRLSTAL